MAKTVVMSLRIIAYLGKLLPLCSSWPFSTGTTSFLVSSLAASVVVSAAGVSVVSAAASVAKERQRSLATDFHFECYRRFAAEGIRCISPKYFHRAAGHLLCHIPAGAVSSVLISG